MWGNLFDSEGVPFGPSNSPNSRAGCSTVPGVPAPRGITNLCGLENLGATCYLNSLIQTLLFTPDFREGLLSLNLDPSDEINTEKVRVIPLQLQKLFAQLLLYDVSTVTTVPLTESFGWRDHEELNQQQDVQELIRILFFAIQKSLVGTPGQDLISNLYQGFTVSKVQCQKCNFQSCREESFLDLTVAVGQCKTLKNSLFNAHCEPEIMSGSNQYLCPTCQTHTDATKFVKIKTLPPVLTISLLRFLYNPQEQMRYKDESRLEFPEELDMSPYCDENLPSDQTNYELLSVIVHKGGAHGGHYYAIINDIDYLGHWDPANKDTFQNNSILRHPALLIRDILNKAQDHTLIVEHLLDGIFEDIGETWAKKYKILYGSILDFLNSNCAFFYLEGNDLNASVTLISDPEEYLIKQQNKEEEENNLIGYQRQWFSFNDSEVLAVNEQDLQLYYEGVESAYMLVYRRKCLERPVEAHNNRTYGVPEPVVQWIDSLNIQLDSDRESAYYVWLRILPGSLYHIYRRNLTPIEDKGLELTLTIDVRESLATLRRKAIEICNDAGVLSNSTDNVNLYFIHQTNYDLNIQDLVIDSEAISLDDLKIETGQLFLASSVDLKFDDIEDNVPNYELFREKWDMPAACETTIYSFNNDFEQYVDVSFQIVRQDKIITEQIIEKMTIRDLRPHIRELFPELDEVRNFAIRTGEDIHCLEPPIQEFKVIGLTNIKQFLKVFIEPCDYEPIEHGQIWLKYSIDDPKYKNKELEIVIDQHEIIESLLINICQATGLLPNEWHLCLENSTGGIDKILKNLGDKICDEPLSHGSKILVCKGLTPTNVMKVHLSWVQNEEDCPSKRPTLFHITTLHLDAENTICDIKKKIVENLESQNVTNYKINENYIRLRQISNGRPSNVIRMNSFTLRSFCKKNFQYCFEVLKVEENLELTQVVLQIWCHTPNSMSYTGPFELIYDPEKENLAEAISTLTGIETENLVAAEYNVKSRTWTPINLKQDEKMITDDADDDNNNVRGYIDGVIIGVKDKERESKDSLLEFTTGPDFERWVQRQEEPELHRDQMEELASSALEWSASGDTTATPSTSSSSSSRLPERGIHIHVSDF